MEHEFEPDKDKKHQQAQDSLNDLQRVLEQIKTDETKQPDNEPAPEEPTAQDEPVQPQEEAEPEEASAEAAAEQPEQPEQPEQADVEQMQREAILDGQAKRRHPDQPAATVHLDKTHATKKAGTKQAGQKPAAAKKGKNSKARAARRRKKRLMRLGTIVVVLLVAIVLVVSAVKAVTGRGNSTAQGSGISTEAPEKKDDRPASQQESEQYQKIKDDTSLPAYALEYPGLYSDAVSKPNKESEEKVCYMTFDDGPSSTNTPGILDVLKEKGVKATFFIVTSEIDGNEDIIKRIVDEGHTLCIHANDHDYGQLYASTEGYLNDFAAAYDKIYDLTGYRVQGFRFPGGSNNSVMQRHGTYDAIVSEMTRRGFEYYDWNSYAHDAENGNYTVAQMVDYAVSEVSGSSRNDVILLMHDTYGKEKTVEALPSIIDKLKDSGIDMLPITNSTRPVHFEVDETTPSDMPEEDSSSDSSDSGDTSDSEDNDTSEN